MDRELDSFTECLCREMQSQIQKKFGISLSNLASNFSRPPAGTGGHWAFPCFVLSSSLKKKPSETAQILSQAFTSSSVFEKAEAKGPYLNFFIKTDVFEDKLLKPLLSGKLFHQPARTLPAGEEYLIEYSQPNTHKELHIGHLRNLCFGLSLSLLLKKRGFPVRTCTFPGDSGAHTAKCLWYLKFYNKETKPAQNKGQWLGKIYTKACAKFEEEKNKPECRQAITLILQELKQKKGSFYKLWVETRQWSHEQMQELYTWAGASFDKWYWESEVDAPSVEWIQKLFAKGLLQKSEGAIGLDLGKELGFCLLLKSEGSGLYAAKDLYLARKKFEDYKIFKNIYIVDQRQERHFRQIIAVLDKIGFSKASEKSQHLKYNFVELPSGAMRSRQGNVVPVLELIQNMESAVKENFLNKYKDWPESKKQFTAKMIAEGALKFGMNDQDLSKKIVFHKEEWLRLDGRSGPYIQYAYARSCTLLKKLAPDLKDGADILAKNKGVFKVLSQPEEWDLLTQLSWFSLVMEKSAQQMKTSPICQYLYELAKKFSKFYQNCPIGTASDLKQKQARLLLVKAVQLTLKEGLSYLAVPAPSEM